MTRPRRAAALAAAVSLATVPAAVALGSADAVTIEGSAAALDTTGTDPTFTRHNVDTAATGAAFTSVGHVFGDEQDIVTSLWGTFDGSRPEGPGSLVIYRPGATLDDWEKVTVFGPEAGIIVPNATTLDDVDGDGDTDLIVPSGHFFGTDPGVDPSLRTLSGSITWWENVGTDEFVRHDVITDQAGAYHGVQFIDFDGDGIKDLLSVAEEARAPGDQFDDTISTQFFHGRADHTFAAPVELADVGGSQPVIADVDGDGDLDIASARYFDPVRDGTFPTDFPAPSFLWIENGDTDGVLSAADFSVHPIATINDVSMGFQMQPVVGFREPSKVSWIGTNHANRCTFATLAPALAAREQVIEFVPGKNIRKPWQRTTLSDPDTPVAPCPADYFNRDKYPEWSDAITSRYSPGQGAPGTFGYGDIDGDGDLDLGVSGDGDRRLWWIEQQADGETTLHRLTGEGEYFGQSGGGWVVDFNGDGVNELVFSSWDQNTVAIWTPTGTVDVPVVVTSKLSASPGSRTVKANKKTTWTLKLTGAQSGPARTVTVTFDPAKGKNLALGKVTLGPAGASSLTGKLTWKPKASGRLVFDYAGITVTEMLSDTAARATAKVKVKKK